MWIKICGITNTEDALLATALGADALGFVFAASSKRRLTVAAARDIVRELPPEVMPIGVFRGQSAAEIVDIVTLVGLKAVQLHGDETPEQCAAVRPHVNVLIKAFAAGDPALDDVDVFGADAVHIDSPAPGSGEVFDWSLAEGAPSNRRIILAGGLTADNVTLGIELVRPWGVDVSTAVEAAPGRKDPQKLRAFINAARSAPTPSYESPQPGPFDWQNN